MAERREEPAEAELGLADRTMLAEIKANVLGRAPEALRIGRFTVLERLGEGSMGAVYAALDDQLQRRVALKLLHQGVGASEDERRARMLREAQVLAQLTHPNIVQVHEAGEHEGQVFMAMELVDGQTLDELQRTHPPDDWKTLLNLYLEAGCGLAAAHAKGVVHRDFKPHNVIVDRERRVRVVDFGLARGTMGIEQQHTAELPVASEGAIERARSIERLTATGAIPGTPAYMAPELFDGEPATALSDQFSFCVALYEAIYGRRPFVGTRVDAIVSAAKQGRISPAPADRSAPRWLFKAIERGLAAEPQDRHPSMHALLTELERERGGLRRAGGVLLGVSLVGAAAWWGGSQAVPTPVSADASRDHEVARAHAKSCTEQADTLRSRWQEVRDQLTPGALPGGDVDGLAALEPSAEDFFERWKRSCIDDVQDSDASCREASKLGFDGVLEHAQTQKVHEDVFHELTYSLALCLEAGTPQCRGSEVDRQATEMLVKARKAEHSGSHGAALELYEDAIRLADLNRDDLTRARALLHRGSIHEARGELAPARESLEEALFQALLCQAKVVAVDITLEQAETESLHSGDEQQAQIALDHTRRLLANIPAELPLRRARVFEEQAAAMLYLEHRCAESVELLEKALAIREQAIEKRKAAGFSVLLHERLAADAQLNLANAEQFALSGDWPTCVLEGVNEDQMIEHYLEARERFASTVGSDRHLGLVEYNQSLGAAWLQLDEPGQAIEPFESALAIYDAHHGSQNLRSANIHRALAATHRELGNLEAAGAHARKNLDIRILHTGEEGQRLALAEAHDLLGVVMHEAGDLERAEEAVLEALGALPAPPDERLSLKELDQLRWSYVNLALVEWDRGERAATRRALQKLDGVEQVLFEREGINRPDLPQRRLLEARLLVAAGRVAGALRKLEGAEHLPGINRSIAEEIVAERERASSMSK